MCLNLLECKKGDKVVITKIKAKDELKRRLISFGLIKGVDLEILNCSPGKKTVEIKVDKTRLALRKEEASLIEVECEE